MWRHLRHIGLVGWCFLSLLPAQAEDDPPWFAGVARVNITPSYPVRLAGYAARAVESQGVAQDIWAKALAIGRDSDGPALLLTVDNCGLPAAIRDELLARLRKRHPIDASRLVVCATHAHSAPWVKGFLPNHFLQPLTREESAHVDQYRRELLDSLEAVADEALEDRKPARLLQSRGEAHFATNRRARGGPIDPDLPVLAVTDLEGKLRAILTTYACHGSACAPGLRQICGDWPGFAQEYLEAAHPGAVAMVTTGCAGELNPSPQGSLEIARQHGQEIATAVEAALTHSPSLIKGKLLCRRIALSLRFDTLPTRDEWTERASHPDFAGLQANQVLDRLDRGEKLPTRLAYEPQAWLFGRDLAMVFLPGEVVVDYALRLKRELDPRRLWLHTCANDMPCYIPSERVLAEGGYESTGAMVYYDQPAGFKTGIEQQVIGAVHDLVPADFRARPPRK